MARIYANLIIKGLKTFDQVPNILKTKVKQVLINLGKENLIEE